jgi:hypothetical protein
MLGFCEEIADNDLGQQPLSGFTVLSTDMGNTIVSDSGVGLVILPGGVSELGFIISRCSEGSGARVLSLAS